MNTFATITVAYRFLKVTYYTIVLHKQEETGVTSLNLFDEFLKKKTKDLKDDYDIIQGLLTRLGTEKGAKKHYFRHERRADALPPSYIHSTDLRLYCFRVSESAVILFNGDLKTEQKAQLCPNVKRHFDLANKLCTQIDELIKEGLIVLDPESNRLVYEKDFKFQIT